MSTVFQKERLVFHQIVRTQYLIVYGFQVLADNNLTADSWQKIRSYAKKKPTTSSDLLWKNLSRIGRKATVRRAQGFGETGSAKIQCLIFEMPNQVPNDPKIYHIVHVDRLLSIIADGILCDAEVVRRKMPGTTIGMSKIKERRRTALRLTSHPDLFVGDCAPFYFCPRSIMLYLMHQGNHPDLMYRGGQGPIIHLEADLRKTVAWAEEQGQRWAFTLSNAGAYYFEDRCELGQLGEIDWNAVRATDWRGCKEGKQAEFLVESVFPWALVSRVGVMSRAIGNQVLATLQGVALKPVVEIKPEWYY